MERLVTVEEIKEQVKRENSNKENVKKTELISYMAKKVKGIFEGNYYFTKLDSKEYLVNDIKEIAIKMGCSLIYDDNELYLCIEKQPNEWRIIKGLSSKYSNFISSGFCLGIGSSILFSLMIILSWARQSEQEFLNYIYSIPNEILLIMGIPTLGSFVMAGVSYIQTIQFLNRKLICKDGIYMIDIK